MEIAIPKYRIPDDTDEEKKYILEDIAITAEALYPKSRNSLAADLISSISMMTKRTKTYRAFVTIDIDDKYEKPLKRIIARLIEEGTIDNN